MRWEYRVVWLKNSEQRDQETLNNLGKEGWELVSVTCDYNVPTAAYFKRELRR